MNLSFTEYENSQLKELDWMYGRLIKQKQDEDKKSKGK